MVFADRASVRDFFPRYPLYLNKNQYFLYYKKQFPRFLINRNGRRYTLGKRLHLQFVRWTFYRRKE